MVSFALTSVAIILSPCLTSGFVSPLSTNKWCNNKALSATETFQRKLLESQLSDSSTSSNADQETLHSLEILSGVTTDTLSLQNSLLRISATTDRGQFAKADQKNEVVALVSELEKTFNPVEGEVSDGIPSTLTGTWELVYTNTQLFRSSPFFLAGRHTCKTEEQAEQYSWFCDMHRAALAISTIGVVRQIISKNGKLTNEFEVMVGAVPFLSDFTPFKYSGGMPFTIDGSIVSTADATPTSATEWEIWMDKVEIKGSNIPLLRNVLDSKSVALKSRDLSDVLEQNVAAYEVPKPVLKTTFVDKSMRLVRDVDDNIFVYARVSDSEEPTDYSSVMADLGIGSFLEKFNDAITKVYL